MSAWDIIHCAGLTFSSFSNRSQKINRLLEQVLTTKPTMNNWSKSTLTICLALAATIGWSASISAKPPLSRRKIADLAERVTVRIDVPGRTGSGVLVKREGSAYWIVTAKHVIKGCKKSEECRIVIGANYFDIKSNTLHTLKDDKEDIDLAWIKITTNVDLPVAEIGASNTLKVGDEVYVSGFPVSTEAVAESVYTFLNGSVIGKIPNDKKTSGYNLIYNNKTLPGMSGGPIFDRWGLLIGIHGQGDSNKENSQSNPINPNVREKNGRNLGISSNTVVARATQIKIDLRVALIDRQEQEEVAKNTPTPAPATTNKKKKSGDSTTTKPEEEEKKAEATEEKKPNPRDEKIQLAIKHESNGKSRLNRGDSTGARIEFQRAANLFHSIGFSADYERCLDLFRQAK
jgi:S1-C subfamily serine protease